MPKLKVYRADVHIYGTLYVRATTKVAATRIANRLKGTGFEIRESDGEIPVSGKPFESSRLPRISLSPAMTLDTITEAMGIAGE
jgi:hypothetical protein